MRIQLCSRHQLSRFIWCFLSARFLHVDWLINDKWLVPLIFCQSLLILIFYLPGIITTEVFEYIIVYIPQMTTIQEFSHVRVLKNMLFQYKDNMRAEDTQCSSNIHFGSPAFSMFRSALG